MRFGSLLLLGVMSFSSTCFAAEKLVSEDNKVDLDISIYNQNLALVKDQRSVDLTKGINDIAFEGVATQIKPETAILYADGIKVLEQNYDYAVLTYINMIEKSVGQTVKTARFNHETGENIFESGKIISSTYGSPVIQFDYGIESNYPGRVVFDILPPSLRSKPTLVAKVDSSAAGNKNLSLAYLTSGISWKTNYVAQISDDSKLNLTGWVTINNESGVDYKNAKVQLIAGDVNLVEPARPMPRMMMAKAVKMEYAADTGAGGNVAPESLSGYHLYNLPLKTDIKNQQTKQISLIEKEGVNYQKIAKLYSSLYFYPNSNANFEQQHPDMIYVINNVEESNLGVPLPEGVVRFYENDNDGGMQFIGENSIGHVAKGEKMRLTLGKFFNIFVNGKVSKINKLAESRENENNNKCYTLATTYAYDSEVTFTNSENKAQEIIFEQNLPQDAKVVSESIKGELKQAGVYKWKVNVPADNKQVLTFTVQAVEKNRNCY